MMTYAYQELYLSDAVMNLSGLFDYSINVCKIEPELLSKLFVNSGIAHQFEIGNPAYISGKSGIEIAYILLQDIYQNEEFPEYQITYTRSKEYWAGYILAQYQFYTAKRYEEIFKRISLTEIIDMYNIYHEMDISNVIEALNEKYDSVILTPKLKIIRTKRGISQNELSTLSGVSLRSIQLYEQRVNDIDKAQGSTLYKLSRVLGCEIEDLLENPER